MVKNFIVWVATLFGIEVLFCLFVSFLVLFWVVF